MSNPLSGTQFHHALALDQHSQTALLRADPLITNALQTSQTHSLPSITVSPLQGQYLYIQCKLIGAKSVLEIGTLGGYSAIWFARAGAHVTSIEIDRRHRDIAVENTRGLPVDVILGAALDVLPRLAAEGRSFDLVFVDASWDEQAEYFDWAVKLTRTGGCVYVDNVVRKVLESGVLSGLGGKESLVQKVGSDHRVTATLIPTVGAHKEKEDETFDGFLLAVVN